jgi:hypothetical protein
MAYRSRNGKAVEFLPKKEEQQLSGLPFAEPPKKTLAEIFAGMSYNPAYMNLKNKLSGLKQERDSKEKQRVQLINHLHQVIKSDPILAARLAAAALGGGGGYLIGEKGEKGETAAVFGVIGFALFEFLGNKEGLIKQKENQINALETQIAGLQRTINWLDIQIVELEDDLAKTPKTIEKETFDFINKIKEPVRIEVPQREKVALVVPTNSPPPAPKYSAPISTEELVKKEFRVWSLDDPWSSLLGEPEESFHYSIYGKPGQGKSTFAIKFAHYLSSQKGKVIYNSSEEGVSKTLVDNLKRLDAANPYLLVTQCKTLEELIPTLRKNPSPFVFIDSANNMNIKASDIETLKNMFPKNAFVVINQSTKDGSLRGSQEFTHNADTVIKIENGIAYTEKNRYGKSGATLQIFK